MSLTDRITSLALALRGTRADAMTQPQAAQAGSGASIANLLSGLGGARDSGATAKPNLERDYLSEEELIALMRGGVYRRIVELKPRWATVKGFSVTDDTDEEQPLAKELRALKVGRALRRADIWGRALGESRLLMVTDDPAPLDQPLDPAKVKALHRLELLDRREFTPAAFNRDILRGELGQPELYHLHPRRPGVVSRGQLVHASRLLRFYGDDLPPSEVSFNGASWSGWGADAIGQTLWDGIRNLSQVGSGGARIAQELSIAVFKLSASAGTGDEREKLLARMRALNLMKSLAHAVWLREKEGFERVAANPTGFKDLSEHARHELAAMTGYPLTLLYGMAPGGLSTDGDSWQEMWYSDVASYWDDRYRAPVETIVEILYYAKLGAPPDEWSVEPNPMGELSDKERADIRLLHTQADTVAILDGVLDPEEVREGRYGQPGGFKFELQPVEQRPEPAAPPSSTPEDEAAARRMIERALGATEPTTEDGDAEG